MIAFDASGKFAYTTQDVALPDPSIGGTLMGWFRMNSVTGGQGLVQNGVQGDYFNIVTDNTDLKCLLWSKNKYVTASSVLSLGTLYHMAFTWVADGTKTYNEIFLNGVSQASGSNTADTPTPDIVQFATVLGYLPAVVDIGDVRIYKRVLTADELTTIYACQGTDGLYDDLVYWWKMDEGPPGTSGSGGAYDFYDFAEPVAGYSDCPGNLVGSPVYVENHLKTRRVA
jgi:hypothetical protein